MALTKKNEYSVGDVNLTALMDSTDKQRKGKHDVSLTEYDTTNEPSIAAGSVVEINGALFEAESDESISESPSDGDVYIKLIPDGLEATAEFTNDAPTWDDEKQGWYESGTNNRYLNYIIDLDSGDYTKYKLENESTTLKVGGDINTKGEIQYQGTPIYGYMTDGTPLFAKEIQITVPNGFANEPGAHGISNALSNDRIKDIRSRVLSGGEILMGDGYEGASDVIALRFGISNTHITVWRGGTGSEVTFTIFIIYE